MENKEKQSELLEITNDFFKKVNLCFGDNTPGNKTVLAIVLDGDDANTALVGKKDIIAKSIAAAMADDIDMRDVVVEACKAYAAHSLVEKFGGSHE